MGKTKYVIIAGAGVSRDYPSEFPTAIQIINDIFCALALDDSIQRDLLRNDIREGICDECKLSGDFLRFETLIDVLSLVDKKLNVLDAIKYYSNPNLNHYNLARLAIEGHYVFTPNFDDLIERAILDLGHTPKTICLKNDYKSFSFASTNAVPVFKLHGSYYRYTGDEDRKIKAKRTIQASLTSILSKNDALLLDPCKINLLAECVKKSSEVIFVGYSGSDDFDIVPSLMSLDLGNVLWINHNESVCYKNTVKKYLDKEGGRSRLLRKQFDLSNGTVKLYDTNTSVFLTALGKQQMPHTTIQSIRVTFKNHIANWANELLEDEKYYIFGKLYQSLELYDKAIKQYLQISNTSNYYIDAQLQLYSCLDQQSKYDEALSMLRSLKTIINIEDEKNCLEIIGAEAYLMYRRNENVEGTEKRFLHVIRASGKNSSLRQNTMNNYALFLRDQGRIVEAMIYFRRSYNLAGKHGDLQRKCWVASNMANLLFDKGRIDDSEKILNEGCVHAEMLGDQRQAGVFENLLANISYLRDELDLAIAYCNRSIERDKYLGNESDSSVNELLLGQCYFNKEDYRNASEHYEKALDLFSKSDDQYFLYELLFNRIVLFLTMSNYSDANKDLECFYNFVDQTDNKIAVIHYRIAKKLIERFVSCEEDSFKQDLRSFICVSKDSEVVAFANAVWSLACLGVPRRLIGKRYILKAAKLYFGFNNQKKYEYLSQY